MLKNYFINEFQAAKKLYGIDFVFMQDNAPCHKTRKVDAFLRKKEFLPWNAPPKP